MSVRAGPSGPAQVHGRTPGDPDRGKPGERLRRHRTAGRRRRRWRCRGRRAPGSCPGHRPAGSAGRRPPRRQLEFRGREVLADESVIGPERRQRVFIAGAPVLGQPNASTLPRRLKKLRIQQRVQVPLAVKKGAVLQQSKSHAWPGASPVMKRWHWRVRAERSSTEMGYSRLPRPCGWLKTKPAATIHGPVAGRSRRCRGTHARTYVLCRELGGLRTRRQVSQLCSIDNAKAYRTLRKLVDDGLIMRVGNRGRNVRYRLRPHQGQLELFNQKLGPVDG